MNLIRINEDPIVEEAVVINEDLSSDQFIHANTEPILQEELKSGCIIPVFSKDNESTISHTEFIETAFKVSNQFFSGEQLLQPNIRVSHPIKGRIPELDFELPNSIGPGTFNNSGDLLFTGSTDGLIRVFSMNNFSLME